MMEAGRGCWESKNHSTHARDSPFAGRKRMKRRRSQVRKTKQAAENKTGSIHRGFPFAD